MTYLLFLLLTFPNGQEQALVSRFESQVACTAASSVLTGLAEKAQQYVLPSLRADVQGYCVEAY